MKHRANQGDSKQHRTNNQQESKNGRYSTRISCEQRGAKQENESRNHQCNGACLLKNGQCRSEGGLFLRQNLATVIIGHQDHLAATSIGAICRGGLIFRHHILACTGPKQA